MEGRRRRSKEHAQHIGRDALRFTLQTHSSLLIRAGGRSATRQPCINLISLPFSALFHPSWNGSGSYKTGEMGHNDRSNALPFGGLDLKSFFTNFQTAVLNSQARRPFMRS